MTALLLMVLGEAHLSLLKVHFESQHVHAYVLNHMLQVHHMSVQ